MGQYTEFVTQRAAATGKSQQIVFHCTLTWNFSSCRQARKTIEKKELAQNEVDERMAFEDSDWCGDRQTRRSTTAGAGEAGKPLH